MIHMPRRSVTRFFIPLIDVLILLFCIFLLMEFETGAKADAESEKAEEVVIENAKLAGQLADRTKELHKFEALRPQLNELAELRDEIERLRNAHLKDLKGRLLIVTIDYDAKGFISFYDEMKPANPVTPIKSKADATALIQRHKKEADAQSRLVYYQFMLPRPYDFVNPTPKQEAEYAKWFAGTENSLDARQGKKK